MPIENIIIKNGRHYKNVDNNFFNGESREIYYVLGLFYSSFNPHYKHPNTFIFTSKYKDLTEIVKDKLKSENAIIKPKKRNSYFIEITSKKLHDKLNDLGLWKEKLNRKFPEYIDKNYLNDFMRGFFDSQGYISKNKKGVNEITFVFNQKFLRKFSRNLNKETGINKKKVNILNKNNHLYGIINYRHENSLRIYDYIYKDFDYVKENNLYLKEKKELFNLNYDPNKYMNKIIKKMNNKICKSKKLLLKGYRGVEISERLGYSNVFQFYNIFKKYTGKTTKQFLKETKQDL
jgi:YesN/AraC family two-component response regulator